jgi:DNA repair photolyase
MKYRSVTCNSLIKRITTIDTLFNGMYCVDPYQNCEFGCLYCDSSFDKDIYVKMNASKILKNELEQLRKGVILIGSVHDPYQKIEKKCEITKNLLKTIKKYEFPCHILTKSNLILRDINLLSEMKCAVTISLTSLDKNITHIFEENAPSPKERLKTVKKFVEHGIKTGLALMPILPFIVEPELENVIKTSNNSNAQYLLHEYLELKGDQKGKFIGIIQKHFQHLLSKYDILYKDNFKPDEKYVERVDKKIHRLCKNYNIPEKILN